MNEQPDLLPDGDNAPLRDCPPAMRRALRKINAADVLAGLRLADELARIFRPRRDRAGLGTLGDAARVFFGLAFENAGLRYFEVFCGLRHDAPDFPREMLPGDEAVREARRMWARHLLGRLTKVQKFLRREAGE